MNITEDKYIMSSYFARDEADRWLKASTLCKKNVILNRESYVMQLFACELYLKCLLMLEKINILNEKTHKLKKLYDMLPNCYKLKIKELVSISPLEIIDKEDNVINVLETFDSFLDYISKGFINYRYEYENFANDNIVIIPILFIESLSKCLYNICKNIPYEVSVEK